MNGLGLFSFKKKAKTDAGSALDLSPPMPPEGDVPAPPSDFDMEVPKPAGADTLDNFPEPPGFSNDNQSFEMPSFPEHPDGNSSDFSLPPMGDEGANFPASDDFKMDEQPMTEQKPMPAMEEPRPVLPVFTSQPAKREIPRPDPAEETNVDFAKSLFIPIDQYKEVDNDIDLIRNDLKKAADSLERVSSHNSESNVIIEKLSRNADFVLKKLNIIDKKLFKKG